ncbi:MAG TPA: LysM peptidoglycan-binding domain-containing protein [Bacteroidia bacterium]|nr:LysM peptidoglycan-binding domain-containing protein [Bacteroidia bacterium]
MGISKPALSNHTLRAFLCGLLFFCNSCKVVAQREGRIKKSNTVETIDGKKYYLHTVQKGQTLYGIAKAYELTTNDILLENPEALNGVSPGQCLKIPAQKPAVPQPVKDTLNFTYHKVEAGQTLYSISRLYKLKEDSITKYNPEAKTGVKTGQELKIPFKKTYAPAAETIYKGNKKEAYNIALMLPLHLAKTDVVDPELPEAKLSEKQEAAVQFYEGALLAIDSMRKRGMTLNIYVYDMDEGDSALVQTVLAKPEFATTDLIIGPLSPGPFYVASEWAREHQVPIVSPVSPVNRVLFHRPAASKALPSLSTQMEQLALYISRAHIKDNIILLNSGNVREQVAGLTFCASANSLLYPAGTDSVKCTKGFTGLESLLLKDRTNIIVIPSNGPAYVSDLLRLIDGLADRYPIIVFGLSSWVSYDNLDPEYLEKLQLHFVAPWYVDYDSSHAVQKFVIKYNSFFGGDPGQYVFAGYDVGLFYLSALQNYGTDFHLKLPELKGEGLQQFFEFARSDAESGYENQGVWILQVKEYRLHVVHWK